MLKQTTYKIRAHRTISGGGSSQLGSLRAEKMLYDDKRAALEAIRIRDLEVNAVPLQDLKKKHLSRDWFSFVTWPRAETSTEKKWTMKLLARSATRGAYFSDLKLWLRTMLESHGQVSSNRITSWDVSLKIKISGLNAVAKIWGGIVPPWGAWKPGTSAYSAKRGTISWGIQLC